MFIYSQKDKTIRKLFRQGKSYDEIATKTNCSFSQIKKIIDAEKQRIYHDKVAHMHEEGKTYKEISISLDLTVPEIQEMISRHMTATAGDYLLEIYNKLYNSSINPKDFLDLFYMLFQKIKTPQDLEKLISLQENFDAAFEQYNSLFIHNMRLKENNEYLEKKSD